jgi:hypothetical protein
MYELNWNGSVAMLPPVAVDIMLPIFEPLRGLLLNPRDKRRILVIDLITLLQNKQEETLLVQIKTTFSKAKKKIK